MTRLRTLAAVAGALALLAGCGDSPEDQARDDGKDVGKAVRQVADATSVDQAQQAVGDLRSAVQDLHSDTREHVQSQVDTQRDEISEGVDAARTAGSFDQAKTELHSTAQNLRSQADSFRDSNNSIANEFWRGFEEGYDGD
jgi:gas vesicle protein